MTLQWTFIAGFLYLEIFIVVVLMLPFISASTWQRIFQSGLVKSMRGYTNYFFSIFLVLLTICLADSVNHMRKYSHSDADEANIRANPGAVDQIHMKLFRAERNFYIVGFALFLWFVIRRLVTLISSEANLYASKEAALKQAKSASDAARRFMEEKDDGKSSKSSAKEGTEKEDKVENTQNELEELKAQLVEARAALKQKDAEVEAIRSQAESTNREYDRLSEDYQQLQKQLDSGDKKSS